MAYVDQNLISGEAVHYRTGFHWVVLVSPIIVGLFLGFLSLGGFLSGSAGFGLCMLLVAVLIVASAFLRRSVSRVRSDK
jgi:F0F1-type ATP synthase assembly protein I